MNTDDPPTLDCSKIPMSPNPDGPSTPNHSKIPMSPNPNDPPLLISIHPYPNQHLLYPLTLLMYLTWQLMVCYIYYLNNFRNSLWWTWRTLTCQNTSTSERYWQWTKQLYGSQAEFELCNLLYRKSKMPAGQIDELLNIIAVMQAMDGG